MKKYLDTKAESDSLRRRAEEMLPASKAEEIPPSSEAEMLKIIQELRIHPDNSVEISVRDTGIGMNQRMIDNLFRIDTHTHRNGTDGELSTGLGLIICRDFVEKHGGKLWVESEEGKGSTFFFTLPG